MLRGPWRQWPRSVPLHGEFDVLRLQMAPAIDRGLVPVFWEAVEIFRGQLFGGRALSGEFLADERVSCHRALGGTNVTARPWFV